jgi:hypothetical protein
MKDLSKTREVQSDQSASHSLVLQSLEGMVEAYLGLIESVREMVKFTEKELKEQKKDDLIVEQRQQARGNGAAANGNPAPLPPNGRSSAPPSTSGGPPNIKVSIPADTDTAPIGFKIVVTPSHHTRKIVPDEKETPSTPQINTTGGSEATAGSESPYTPKVYQETPVPSPSSKSQNSSSSSSSFPPQPSDLNSTEGKKWLRMKKLGDLQQDYAALLGVKRHCVKTLRALRNAHVLVSAVDCLRDILADKEFQAARLAFQAITEIFHTLVPYSKLPLLRTINDHVECYKAALRKEIFSAFREQLGQSFMGASPSNATQQVTKQSKTAGLTRLHHCCRLIDSLYSNFERKELVKWWVTVSLAGYNQAVARRQFGDVMHPEITQNGQVTGFDHLDKQFAWIYSELRTMWDGEYSSVFPSQWFVDAVFVRRFFEVLRSQVAATLEAQERRIKEENDTRKAMREAKKAQALMAEMNAHSNNRSTSKLNPSGSSSNLASLPKGGSSSSLTSKPGPKQPDSSSNVPSPPVPSRLVSGDSNAGGAAEDETKPVVWDFYKPLLRTIEFENQMRARWLNAQTEGTLTEEDLFAVLGTVPNPALNQDFPQGRNPPPYPFQFAGYISSAFHPYLPSMLKSERQRFYNFLEELDEQETWEVESADITTCHFSAATRLFVMIQYSMEKYTKVMPGDAFLDLFKEYRSGISNYLELLSKHLPTGQNAGESSSSSGNNSGLKHFHLDPEEVSSICATLNTSDYILDRSALLAKTIIQMLSGHDTDSVEELTEEQQSFIGVLREQVDFSQIEEQASHLNHRATHVLASSIVKKLEPFLMKMKEGRGAQGGANGASGGVQNGGSTVNDENKYVRDIILTLRQSLQDKAKMSSFAYLTQVVAQDFLSLFHTSLKSVKFRITESVAQQMLLDLQSLKNFLLHGIPEMKTRAARASIISMRPGQVEEVQTHSDGSTSATAPEPTLPAAFKPFVKLVNTQAAQSENLLKTLTSPNARLIATFKVIFPKADNKAVFELLNLRGLSSSDQEKLIKAYNATSKNPIEHIQIVKKDFFGNIKDMVRKGRMKERACDASISCGFSSNSHFCCCAPVFSLFLSSPGARCQAFHELITD